MGKILPVDRHGEEKAEEERRRKSSGDGKRAEGGGKRVETEGREGESQKEEEWHPVLEMEKQTQKGEEKKWLTVSQRQLIRMRHSSFFSISPFFSVTNPLFSPSF